MRLTYISPDNFIRIDGIACSIPTPSNLPNGLHAIQLYDDGLEIEWFTRETGPSVTTTSSSLPSGFISNLIQTFNKYANKVIVFLDNNNNVQTSLTVKIVPKGKPYILVHDIDIPDEPIETWDVDFSDPDGYGEGD